MTYTLHTYTGAEIDPKTWDVFIRSSPQGSIFLLHGYISIVRSDWQAHIIKDSAGNWCAIMPFCLNKKWRYLSLPQPLYAQYWGIAFCTIDSTPTKLLSLKKKWIDLILEELASIDLIVQNFSPHFDYGIPFHWAGFELVTRYTFWLDLEPGEDILFSHLTPRHRQSVRQARKKGLYLGTSQDPQVLANLMEANRIAGHDIVGKGDGAYQKLQKIANYLIQNEQGQLLIIQNSEKEILAAGIFAPFRDTYIYVAGCQHPDFKSSGAHTLLMWEAIALAKQSGATLFDFEGSMMQGVEHFFRKFGGQPIPYLQIRRNRLPLPIQWIRAFM